MDNKDKKRIVRGILGLAFAFVILTFGGRIIQFGFDVFMSPTFEWQGYVINLGEENRRRFGADDEELLIINNKEKSSASLYFQIYDDPPVEPEISLESFCGLKECYSYSDGVVNIDGVDAFFTNAKYKVKDKENIVEFVNIPNTTIDIEIKTPIAYYESLRNIVNTMKKSQDGVESESMK